MRNEHLLRESNLVMLERVVHATRTVISQSRLDLTPFREGQLVRALYEELVADGAIGLSYEEILHRVEEAFRVSKWRAEAKAKVAEQWPGYSPSWLYGQSAEGISPPPNKFWQWLEDRRRRLAWGLGAAALIVLVVIVHLVSNRWF